MNRSPHVLFVCLGNICRSPCAQAIFQQQVRGAGLDEEITSDSCGTAAFNVDKPADPRALSAMGERAHLLSQHRARQIRDEDFEVSTHVLAMDWTNLNSVRAWAPPGYQGEITLLQDYNLQGGGKQIPDPYYRNERAFLSMIERLDGACTGLFEHIRRQYGMLPRA